MKKLAAPFVFLALVIAACGGSGDVAATVDGKDITVAEVEALVDPESPTISKAQFAQMLELQIQAEIIIDGMLAEWGIQFTEEDIAEEADNLFAEVNVGGESREEFLSSRGLTEQLLREVAHQTLLEEAARVELSDTVPQPSQDEVDARIESSKVELTEVCVSHILVQTEAEALDALSRLDSGETFAQLASELSLDEGSAVNDGELPCTPAGSYVEEFREAAMAAPVGEILQTPVSTDFGFHVMLVTDRTEPEGDNLPTDDEVVAVLVAQAVDNELILWLTDLVAAAEVTVDERFGTWMSSPPQVIPPPEE